MDGVFIPSHGIGEILLDVRDLHWYMLNSSYFSIDKEIPFFIILINMDSLRMRYYHRLKINRLFSLQIIIDLREVTTCFILGFKKLKDLCKDIFAKSDIETLDYCLEVYRQHLNHEKFDFFIADKWKLLEALKRIDGALFTL